MRNLISAEDLNKEQINSIFEKTKKIKNGKSVGVPPQGAVGLLFYENSTRTKLSFEIATKSLNLNVLDLLMDTSSVKKGESLKDTAKTLIDLGCRLLILRHSHSGAALRLAKELEQLPVGIINGGDGMHQHPTQALIDVFTISELEKNLKGLKVSIVGDCLHSRVARSNIALMKTLGISVTLIGPKQLVPKEMEKLGVEVSHDLREGLKGSNYVMVLRAQKERMLKNFEIEPEEYCKHFRISWEVLAQSGLDLQKVKILHPGPVNRGFEICSNLVDQDDFSLIDTQVKNGFFVRKALIHEILGNI
jgi:aspartate carbamoyltransferase catalytic subunit